MLPQSSHIALKNGVYFFRRRVPQRPGVEVTISLRTRCFREAQWLANSLRREFDRIMRQMGDRPDIAKIVRKYLERKLEFDLEQRLAAKGSGVYPPYGDNPQTEDLEWIDCELRTARDELANRRYDHQRPTIDELVDRYSVPPELRNELAHRLLQANVEVLEAIRERTLGRFPSILRDDDNRGNRVRPQGSDSQTVAARAEDDSPFLSAVLPQFLAVMSEDVGWSGQTRAQNEATYRLFSEVCGDKCVSAYTRRDLGEFYHLLRKLPALYSKSAAYREKTPAEIVALADGQDIERLSMRTIKRHFAALSRFFGYLKKQGICTAENPASDFEFPLGGRANQKRQMWEGERLTKLFASPVWSGCKSEGRRSEAGSVVIQDEKYWLPILGLFHGNRLEEFAQLRREDVRCEGGTWYFDINDEGERQIKNEQSRRRVPVHPKVLDLDFIEYVKSVAPEPSSLVFPRLAPGGPDEKLGYYFTKWWTRYRRAIKLYEKGLDYHSFRHGVTTKLYGADVSEPLVDELTGHEGKSTSRVVYKKDLPLGVLNDAISKVAWPEVDGLLSKFAGGQEHS